MSVDLTKMTPAQLSKVIEDAKTALDAAKSKQLETAQAQIRKIIDGTGEPAHVVLAPWRLTSLKKTAPKSSGTRAKPAVQYTDGTNSWTGRGRKPTWMTEYLAKGGKLEDLAPSKHKKVVTDAKPA